MNANDNQIQRPAKLTASQFDSELLGARMAISSLAGCAQREIPNEARILRAALDSLRTARLSRRDPQRLVKRDETIARAVALLESRAAVS